MARQAGATPQRSIPARAGEPPTPSHRTQNPRVYPRTGGGTCPWSLRLDSPCGLSPHGRGNPSPRRNVVSSAGSIPARAGEPAMRRPIPAIPGVYPRTGGGTASCELGAGDWMGLSPHGRGNLIADCRKLLDRGSIPARAGEPSLSRLGRPATWVYPRTGGGTAAGTTSPGCSWGLSPHGRGNQRESDLADAGEGSIPARAGEPGKDRWNEVAEGVYPRTGGGTSSSVCLSRRGWGLSPHGRGNRFSRVPSPSVHGSIPARAGEPRRPAARASSNRVYPRTGGGTPTKQQTDNAQLLRNKCRVCVLTGS